ncbi:hypothetical protein [Streptomyces sp. NPDC053542]|uniref:hypothetical protein n=1 Tax=Streptomyces sp. NPDC053542 TaxID=3365710 RepID=UPI0037D54784
MTHDDRYGDALHERRPAAAAPLGGRRLAAAFGASALALLCAGVLWLAAGFGGANECRESGYGIADAVEMTDSGCRIIVRGEDGRRLRSDPLPTRDGALMTAAVLAAAAAALPPYILVLRGRRRG